ncbi:hypothetical protein [Synechococcus sp. M16CYN]|uniref:hypothetical protein n=1 Tax=Synechococcus sp. M16CYN TaxID=3103139 RepID=UPI003250078B
MIRRLLVLLVALFCCVGMAWAGPIDWIEVPSTDAGQQWWDRGSVRENKNGLRTVLSRFTPALSPDGEQRQGGLYVMELDCGQRLYRDRQVNGIPRFRTTLRSVENDDLIMSVIEAVCNEPLSS